MRTIIRLCLLSLVALGTPSLAMYVPGFDQPSDRAYPMKGQFIVQFSDDVALHGVARGFGLFQVGVPSVDRIFDDYRAKDVRPIAPLEADKASPLSRVYVVTLPPDQDDAAFMRAMTANPAVVAIDHDIICRVAASPDDPSHSQQWAYKAGSQLLVHEAWDIETGSDTVIIAIIDTGENYRHPDLKNNIWVNPAEDIDGDGVVFDSTDINGVDNGGNLYVDDLVGYDFVSSTTDPWPGEDGSGRDNDPIDFNGHGTACSGVAAAVTNNGTGVAGLSGGWGPLYRGRGAQIMCLRAGFSGRDPNNPSIETGFVIMSAVVEAVNYAVNNGADVISYSAGSSNVSGMASALTAAMNAGIVFCAAAGNDNWQTADYFGVYNGILAVAAVGSDDRKSSYSNYGTWVEVSAPGDQIYSTNSYHGTPGYTNWWGTSFSAPMTAGLAALIKSHYPGYTKAEIDTMILNHADNIDAVNPTYIGKLGRGRINAYNTLANAPVAKFSGTPQVGPAPLIVAFTDQSPAAASWQWSFGDGQFSSEPNPTHEYTALGPYTVSLQVTDPNGTTTKVSKNFAMVTADTLSGQTMILQPGVMTEVPISLKNTAWLENFDLAFHFQSTGSATFTYNGCTVVGTRTENFGQFYPVAELPTDVSIRFIGPVPTSKDGLFPGNGPVVKLLFTASGVGTIIIDTTTLGDVNVMLRSRFQDYQPICKPLVLNIARRGDANSDGFVNVGDAVYIINFIFKGGPAPDPVRGDANGDGSINIGDSVFIINYIFKGGPPPPP